MVVDDVLQERAIAGEVARSPADERLGEHRVVGERRAGEVLVQCLPQRDRLPVLRHRLEQRQKVEGASAHVGVRAAQHDRRERRAGTAVLVLLAQCAAADEPRAASGRIGRIRRHLPDLLRGRLVLYGKPARSEHRQRRLEQRGGSPIAGAPALAQRRQSGARDLIHGLAVAMRVEQHFGAPHEARRVDRRAAGADLPFPRAGGIGRR